MPFKAIFIFFNSKSQDHIHIIKQNRQKEKPGFLQVIELHL